MPQEAAASAKANMAVAAQNQVLNAQKKVDACRLAVENDEESLTQGKADDGGSADGKNVSMSTHDDPAGRHIRRIFVCVPPAGPLSMRYDVKNEKSFSAHLKTAVNT